MLWAVFLVAACLLTALLAGRISDPPFWDAAWSTSTGAVELARNGFDYPALLSAPGFSEGGPGSHSASLLTPLLGLGFLVFGSPGGLVAGHLLMIGFGGALATATFALGRRFLPPRLALLVAGAVVLLPVVVQQIGDPYVEVPLALFTILTVLAVLDGDRARAALFVALGIWFKPTGLMLIPLLATMGQTGEFRRWRKNALASAIAFAPFSIQLMAPSITTSTGISSTIRGTLDLLGNAVMVLGSTTDVLLILGLFALAVLRQHQNHPELVRVSSVLTVGLFAIVVYTIVASQGVTMLPRYYVALLPLWLTVITVHLTETQSSRVTTGFLVVLLAFSLVNWHGRFYPLADHSHPVMAERSPGAAKQYLQLEIMGTRTLAEMSDSVDVLVLERAMYFRFTYPELGFLNGAPGNTVFELNPNDLPESFAWVDEPYVSRWEVRLTQFMEDGQWSVERRPIGQGRWSSDLVIARRP